jgi:hypothetical protein
VAMRPMGWTVSKRIGGSVGDCLLC